MPAGATLAEPRVAPPLAGRHAVVTGASRGIGATAAASLARLGAKVTLMARDETMLAKRVAEMEARAPLRVQAVAIDVTDPEGVARAFARAVERFGPAHILVNNAGAAAAAPFHKTDLQMWQKLIAVDLTGAFLCIRQGLSDMIAAGFGRVINVASTAGLTGYPYVTAYCAAKHGLIGLTRALAQETARTGVTVNAVCPGYTDTDLVATAIDNIVSKTRRSREQALQELVAHNPQGRLVTPEEVAETIAWLSLPSSSAITGQSIVVAGGELM
jgi:NAD(P)-dependent dehydrogenase (short-subunit alcohol dehydrogenase family)